MNYLGSLVSLVRVMSWSMNWPHTTSSTVTAWSWNPSSYNNIHTKSRNEKKGFQPCAREQRQHVEWEEVDR